MPLLSAYLAFFCLAAALLRTPGLIVPADGVVDWTSLGLVFASLASTMLALRRPKFLVPDAKSDLSPLTWDVGLVVLVLLLALELYLLGTRQPSVYRDPPAPDWPLRWFRLGVAALGLLALCYVVPGLRGHSRLARWRFPAMLAAFVFLGGWVIMTASYRPFIDVWHLQQDACAEVWAGRNPYSADYVNIYGNTLFIGPEVLKNGRVQSFPYPPVSLLMAFPGYLFGDVRWSLLLAMVASGALMVAAGRRLGLPPGHPVELIVIALLCLPTLPPGPVPDCRGLIMLEMAWTEPFVLLGIVAGVWALAGGKRLSAIGALALALGAKQYVFLTLPAWWGARRLSLRALLAAGAGAALLILPFLVWDPVGLWNGLVRFHLYSPFREDSLSFLAAIAVETGRRLPAALGFVAAFAVGAWVARPKYPSIAHVLLGGAAIFLAFFVFNKAAHLNYHWLALALLAAAVIVCTAERTPTDAGVGPGKAASANQPEIAGSASRQQCGSPDAI